MASRNSYGQYNRNDNRLNPSSRYDRSRRDYSEKRSQSGRFEERPQSGRFEGRPQSGRFEERPQPGRFEERSQSGRYEDRPQPGRFEERPKSGRYEERPQSGRFEGRPQSGRFEERPQPGRFEERPQSGYEERSQYGRDEGRSQSGRDEGRSQSGRFEKRSQSDRYEERPHSGRYEERSLYRPSAGGDSQSNSSRYDRNLMPSFDEYSHESKANLSKTVDFDSRNQKDYWNNNQITQQERDFPFSDRGIQSEQRSDTFDTRYQERYDERYHTKDNRYTYRDRNLNDRSVPDRFENKTASNLKRLRENDCGFTPNKHSRRSSPSRRENEEHIFHDRQSSDKFSTKNSEIYPKVDNPYEDRTVMNRLEMHHRPNYQQTENKKPGNRYLANRESRSSYSKREEDFDDRPEANRYHLEPTSSHRRIEETDTDFVQIKQETYPSPTERDYQQINDRSISHFTKRSHPPEHEEFKNDFVQERRVKYSSPVRERINDKRDVTDAMNLPLLSNYHRVVEPDVKYMKDNPDTYNFPTEKVKILNKRDFVDKFDMPPASNYHGNERLMDEYIQNDITSERQFQQQNISNQFDLNYDSQYYPQVKEEVGFRHDSHFPRERQFPDDKPTGSHYHHVKEEPGFGHERCSDRKVQFHGERFSAKFDITARNHHEDDRYPSERDEQFNERSISEKFDIKERKIEFDLKGDGFSSGVVIPSLFDNFRPNSGGNYTQSERMDIDKFTHTERYPSIKDRLGPKQIERPFSENFDMKERKIECDFSHSEGENFSSGVVISSLFDKLPPNSEGNYTESERMGSNFTRTERYPSVKDRLGPKQVGTIFDMKPGGYSGKGNLNFNQKRGGRGGRGKRSFNRPVPNRNQDRPKNTTRLGGGNLNMNNEASNNIAEETNVNLDENETNDAAVERELNDPEEMGEDEDMANSDDEDFQDCKKDVFVPSKALIKKYKYFPPSALELSKIFEGFVVCYFYKPKSVVEKNPFVVLCESFRRSERFGKIDVEDGYLRSDKLVKLCTLRYSGLMLVRGVGQHGNQKEPRVRAGIELINNFAQYCYTLKMKDSYFHGKNFKEMLKNKTTENYRFVPKEEVNDFDSACKYIDKFLKEDSDCEVIFELKDYFKLKGYLRSKGCEYRFPNVKDNYIIVCKHRSPQYWRDEMLAKGELENERFILIPPQGEGVNLVNFSSITEYVPVLRKKKPKKKKHLNMPAVDDDSPPPFPREILYGPNGIEKSISKGLVPWDRKRRGKRQKRTTFERIKAAIDKGKKLNNIHRYFKLPPHQKLKMKKIFQ